jgi:hypothetical protein
LKRLIEQSRRRGGTGRLRQTSAAAVPPIASAQVINELDWQTRRDPIKGTASAIVKGRPSRPPSRQNARIDSPRAAHPCPPQEPVAGLRLPPETQLHRGDQLRSWRKAYAIIVMSAVPRTWPRSETKPTAFGSLILLPMPDRKYARMSVARPVGALPPRFVCAA